MHAIIIMCINAWIYGGGGQLGSECGPRPLTLLAIICQLNEAKSNEDIGAIVVLEHSMDLLQRAGINNQVKVKVDYEYKNI